MKSVADVDLDARTGWVSRASVNIRTNVKIPVKTLMYVVDEALVKRGASPRGRGLMLVMEGAVLKFTCSLVQ